MRPGTEGTKRLRALALLLAGLACLAVVVVAGLAARRLLHAPDAPASDPPDDPAVASQLLIEQQLKLVAEQSELVKEELRRLHEARIELRRERIGLLAERYASGKVRQYDKILIHNDCRVRVAVALHYRDLDGAWITRGWWMIAPDETVTTDAMTRNAYVYFFAENRSVERRWDGAGVEHSKALPVVDLKFDHLEGERFVYDAPRTVHFYRRKTADAWTDHVEEIRCYLEAPDPAARGDGPA